jgi:hypothetical protein
MTETKRRCAYCGEALTGKRAACETCRRCDRIESAASCEPRAWDAMFDARALFALLHGRARRRGGWVLLTRELPCTSEDAAAAVRRLRRMGVVVEGDSHRGRRIVGLMRNDRAVACGDDAD